MLWLHKLLRRPGRDGGFPDNIRNIPKQSEADGLANLETSFLTCGTYSRIHNPDNPIHKF